MNIHLVRSSEYSKASYWDVVDLLQRYPGLMQFRSREEPVEFEDSRIISKPFNAKTFDRQNTGFLARCVGKRIFPERIETISWVSLFESCQAYRKQYDIGDDEFVILLTEYSNDNNWFAAGNPEPGRDAFVQTSHWDYFLGGDERYPVAYHVVLMILIKLLFKSYEDGFLYWHKEAVGCMMDFCEDKKQIILKLRTGDLCPDCLALIRERGIDRQVLAQMFSILDGIRGQMLFKQRYAIQQKPPEMHIDGHRQTIRFPELGNLEIRLTPLEKTVYLFFLQHPEGIEMNRMHEHRHELEELYGRFSKLESIEQMRNSIGELCDVRSNSLSEKLSRIKSKFITALGKEMARPFLISGESREPRKIPISRELVIQNDI